MKVSNWHDIVPIRPSFVFGYIFTGIQDSDDDLDCLCPEDDPDSLRDGHRTPLEEADLSIRSYNCLKRAGYHYLEQVASFTDEDFAGIRNLGRKSAAEIRRKLSELRIAVPEKEAGSEDDNPEKRASEMLDELIGLENVKEQIRKITVFARMRKDMDSIGKGSIPMVLNMEFTGNPGTAKTTVARLLAGILHELGILSQKEPVEVGRADLIARYEGQTADRVRSVFERADGRLLFIDEAYSLSEGFEAGFGNEAINTIVKEMENRRDRTVVIFAGYPDRMEKFFQSNSGLRSRVPFHIDFRDYSVDEMVRICELEADRRGFSIDASAKEKISSLCAQSSGDPGAKNGRLCRNLVENAILEYAARVYSPQQPGPQNDFVLSADDFRADLPTGTSAEKNRIGFAA